MNTTTIENDLNFTVSAENAGSFLLTFSEKHLEWDERSFAIFGIPADEFTATTADWIRNIHPDDKFLLHQIIEYPFSSQNTLDIRYRIIHPDGEPRYIWTVATIIRDSAGQRISLAGLHYDETETRKQENLLQMQSLILRHISEGIILVSASDGMLVFTNPVFEQMFGYQPGELLGQNVSVLNSNERQDPDDIAQQIFQHLNKTGCWQGEIKNKKKDNSTLWCYAKITAFEHPQFGPVWVSVHQDITEQKQAAFELQNLEIQFRKVIDASPIPYALNDDQGNITYLNPAFTQAFGYDSNDIPTLDDWWPRAYPDPSYRQTIIDSWYENLTKTKQKNSNVVALEANITCKDGTLRTALIGASTLSDHFESNHLVILYDITERKQMENALRNSKENYQLLFEHMTSAFALNEMIYDESGRAINWRYIEANPAFETHTGIPVHNLSGKTVLEVLPALEPYWIETFNKVATTGIPIRYENYVKELGRYYETYSFSPIKGRFAVIFNDITERKQAEAELLSTHNRLENIQFAMDQVGIGIHIVSAKGQFIYVNHAACTMLGYNRKDFLTMAAWDIDPNFPAEDYIALTTPLRKQAGRIETTHITQDGCTIPVEATFHFIAGSGDTDGHFIAFITNLSERKQAEKEKEHLQHQLLQMQKMESIGHLTGGIAHDFNNMLASILGYTELTQDLFNQQLIPRDKGIKYLDKVLTSGNRAKELIAQMLTFSRGQTGQPNNKTPVILLQPVIKKVTKLLRASIPSTIELNYKIDEADIKACIEPIQLHQILLNLGINARDAIATYGHINIDVRHINTRGKCASCHQTFRGEYVELSMMDNGTGIPEILYPKIFDPFFTTKDVGKGTGMGLSVVHGIVHAVNGHVTLTNKENSGTTVHILLPWVQTAATTSPIKNNHTRSLTKSRRLDGMKIMVVDDEPSNTALLNELLTLHGAEVTAINQPVQALEKFEQDPAWFDLIITDQTMPMLSGLDLARRMLQHRPGLPIILCTGYSEQVNADIARLNGIRAFMNKPISFHKLIDTVSELAIKQKQAHGEI